MSAAASSGRRVTGRASGMVLLRVLAAIRVESRSGRVGAAIAGCVAAADERVRIIRWGLERVAVGAGLPVTARTSILAAGALLALWSGWPGFALRTWWAGHTVSSRGASWAGLAGAVLPGWSSVAVPAVVPVAARGPGWPGRPRLPRAPFRPLWPCDGWAGLAAAAGRSGDRRGSE